MTGSSSQFSTFQRKSDVGVSMFPQLLILVSQLVGTEMWEHRVVETQELWEHEAVGTQSCGI